MDADNLFVMDQGRMKRTLHEIVMAATVQASHTVAETLSLGFDNCTESGCPLTYIQKQHMMQGALFTFREFEAAMRNQVDMTIGLAHLAENDPQYLRDLVGEDILHEMERMRDEMRDTEGEE